jgi:hypothetical protein
MPHRSWSLVLLGLVAVVLSARAADPVPPASGGPAVEQTPASGGSLLPPAAALFLESAPRADGGVLRDPEDKNGKVKQENNGKAKAEEGPKHIRDNAFLVEEAFNQEPGDAQHIFNWINLWDRTPQSRTRDFAFTYTMELPLGSQTHQFSFTTLFLTAFEKPHGGQARQDGDIGDTFLNYRYQLLADDDFLWCAPRFSLILPTGDERFGLGTGELGYQFNLPVSRYGDVFDFHFNAGATYIPDVSVPLANGLPSPGRDLRAVNLGASAFWKPQTNLNFFVEVLALWFEELDDFGVRENTTQVFVNPGVRYAVCQLDEVEWVIGVSVPVGLTRDTPDIGVFAYMSVEHAFRKKNGNGE